MKCLYLVAGFHNDGALKLNSSTIQEYTYTKKFVIYAILQVTYAYHAFFNKKASTGHNVAITCERNT